MKKSYILLFVLLFALLACEKDPCADKVCYNQGTCLDGTCLCRGNWEGDQCDRLKQARAYKVTKVTIQSFPSLNKGQSWDLTASTTTQRPDLHIAIFSDGVLLYSHPRFYEDAANSNIYPFTLDTPVLMERRKEYTIGLYDYDPSSVSNKYQIMTSMTFDANFDGTDTEMALNTSEMTLTLEYEILF